MHNKLVLALLVTALLLIGAVGWKLQTLDSNVAASLRQGDQIMQTTSTTWTSGTTQHTVTTTRNDGESLEDFLKRHDDAVKAAQVIYPPNP